MSSSAACRSTRAWLSLCIAALQEELRRKYLGFRWQQLCLQQLGTSSSSSSSSNKKTNGKFPQWPGGGRDGSVGISATMINRAQGLRLKRRSDLYKFAQDYP